MNDVPQDPAPAPTPPPAQPPPPSAPPRYGPPPPFGWYNGPFPPPGWGPREGLGRSVLRAFVTTLVSVFTVGAGLFGMFIVGIIALVAVAALAGGGSSDTDEATTVGRTSFVEGTVKSKNTLLLVPVHGPILGAKEERTGLFDSLTDVTYGYEVRRVLANAANDPSIKGIVFEMDTPGGTIFGAQAIADGVKEYREKTGRPVVAFVAGVAASGGMWAMAPATTILADSGTLVGSIGVTTSPMPFYNGVVAIDAGILGGGVTTQNGIEYTIITAGRGKDMGSPYRRLTDEERAVLQQSVDRSYDQFVKHIAASRKLPEDEIRTKIGALVYDNETARGLGLIDGTATRQQAYAEAARLAGLRGDDWRVVRRRTSGGFLGGLFSAFPGQPPRAGQTQVPAAGACIAQHTVLAYYGDPQQICRPR